MRSPLFILFLILVNIISCQKEPVKPTLKKAKLTIDIGVQVTGMNKIRKSAHAVEDYKVIIEDSEGSIVLEYARAADMPDTIELAPGSYYVEANSDNLVDAAFESPYYAGRSNEITLADGDLEAISLTCTMNNCAVSVVYSENVVNYFNNYSTIVSNANASLLFDETENRLGHFNLMPISIESILTYTQPDNSTATKVLTGSIPLPEAQQHYEILVDALPDQTGLNLMLTEDNTLVTQTIVLTDGSTARAPQQGELIITEIMADPVALPDNEGEYIELYNTSDAVLNLNGLTYRQNGSDVFTIEEDLFLEMNGFATIARSASVSFTPDFISSLTLTNDGAEMALVLMEGVTETEIFSMDYGAEDFPSASGASIELSNNHLNSTEAVLGVHWCIATSTMPDGDMGSPGNSNSCN